MGVLFAVGRAGKKLTVPVVLIVPIRFPPMSVNQRFPFGPAAIPNGIVPGGRVNGVTTPAGVIRLIAVAPSMVVQRLPSGPVTMPTAELPGSPLTVNSCTAGLVEYVSRRRCRRWRARSTARPHS